MENTLYLIWKSAEFNYTSETEKRKQIDVYQSIKWYVLTGRSSVTWDKALKKANPKKLISYILKSSDQSVDGQIKSTTKYLKRYCGLKYE